MSMRYDKKTDTLHIVLGHAIGESYELEAGNIAAYIDDGDALTEIVIKNASQFIARALAAGVEIKNTSIHSKGESPPVWEDVDSSMISAFKYDESTGILEVAFHTTGVYRYLDVPLHVVEGLRQASSKGSYMRSMIIDAYSYEKGWRRS